MWRGIYMYLTLWHHVMDGLTEIANQELRNYVVSSNRHYLIDIATKTKLGGYLTLI